MLEKLAQMILRIFAWMFGSLFMLSAIIALFSGNFIFAIFLSLGAMLILPPVKERIIQRLPKTNGVMLTTIGCVIVFLSFMTFPSDTTTESTTVESSNEQIVEQVNNETAWDKPIVPVEKLDTKISESTVIQDDKVENVFNNESEVNYVKKQKTIPEPEPEPIRIAEMSNGNNCAGMYKTCGEMANCAEAQRALACGNGKLDRDNDGIPCESICQ